MIELNIFTNCTKYAPSTRVLRNTHKSFVQTFRDIPVTVWCDPMPNRSKYRSYSKNLSRNFPSVNMTAGLSDGYIRAILQSKADYLFMLEHDWIFNTQKILHTLDELVEAMAYSEIYHLRFNKRKNKPTQWDKELFWKQSMVTGRKKDFYFGYCITPCLSNNPHIIHRKTFVEFISRGYIIRKAGSFGVEEYLTKRPELWGAIYGDLNYPATVVHTDGRGV